jgi:hypothetical protein
MGWRQFTKTVPLNPHRNVVVMTTAAGHKKYTAFATKVESLEPNMCCFLATGAPQPEVHPITDDEETDTASVSNKSSWGTESGNEADGESLSDDGETLERNNEPAEPVDFEVELGQDVSVEIDEPLNNDREELYRLQVRAGHLSFAKLRALARRGGILSRLQHCEAPICAACQYGKATRKPRRTKKKDRKIKPATRPRQCVSVDQMESQSVGFVAQMKGILTKGRYHVTTVSVDHHSRLGYVHLQKDTASEETLRAKRAFETYADDHGMTVQHYHANNGRFVDNAWVNSMDKEGQSITY